MTELLRSNIASQGREFPESNVKDGTSYEFFGYNKPMYVRYQGMYLRSLIDPASDDKVYIVQKNGKSLDITDTVDDYFVAYYYTESKSATNISNGKRVPLNYDSAVFVDTKSAEIEYSNNSGDYTPESKKGATIYKNAEIVIAKQPAAVKGLSAKLSKYNSIKASWNKADGADGYRVYYRTGSGKWSAKTVKGTSTVMSGLKSDKTYSVKVKAYNNVNGVKVYSDESAVKSATTLKKVTLTAKVSSGKAKISVSNIKGESGYQIYGKTSKGEWKRVKTLKADKTSYTTVKKLEKGKTYYVKARAYKTVEFFIGFSGYNRHPKNNSWERYNNMYYSRKKHITITVLLASLLVIIGMTTSAIKVHGAESDSEKPGLVIMGDGVKGTEGFQKNVMYLTVDQKEDIKETRDPEKYGLGNCWISGMRYSSYDNHGTGGWHYTIADGLDVKKLTDAVTYGKSDEIGSVWLYSSDTYSTKLIFSEAGRMMYYPLGTSIGSERISDPPMIAYYKTTTKTDDPENGVEPDGPAEKLASGSETYVYGQKR